MNTNNKNILYCSFCGKSQHEVRKLIAGPTVFICDECVELCMDIIKEESKDTFVKHSFDEIISINNLNQNFKFGDIFIIGGNEIINLTIDLIQEFYLTRIYGNYNCEKFINISLIENKMKMIKKINGDKSCHFEHFYLSLMTLPSTNRKPNEHNELI